MAAASKRQAARPRAESDSPAHAWAPPAPGSPVASPVAAESFLGDLGFGLTDAGTWRRPGESDAGPPPQLLLEVEGHEEGRGHTWYVLGCSLEEARGARRTWKVRRRLAQLRDVLHGSARDALGGDLYGELFARTPFASRGAPAGTTERLRAWCKTLAKCINDGKAPPMLVALTLQFLQVPAALEEDAAQGGAGAPPAAAGVHVKSDTAPVV
ncbi:unnamed protein product [Prorocentrum cordatum]|uniref:PX domain-containing protein n=1 Tax=Prorocentrum cordatum TaxID=2364126 RepID=A0ABN9XNM9_9DINO|nr:unnamed protein product [Polarella glacialis]|mmetsp:Transcript_23774/g.67804  ORF Transcript_23774/g.67804 Transcript_23774/m.67804 type:complete len:212 (+) Transcript_23774:2-637(+)